MTSNNPNQQDHHSLHSTDPSSSVNQVKDPRSVMNETVMNPTITNPSTADTDECEDYELPSHQRKQKQMALEQRYTESANDGSPSYASRAAKSILDFWSSPSKDLGRDSRQPQKSSHAGQSQGQLRDRAVAGKHSSRDRSAEADISTQRFNQVMKNKQSEWQAKELKFQQQLELMHKENQRLEYGIQQIQGELGNHIRVLEATVQEARREKDSIKAEYDLFFRLKQEESFKQLESWRDIEGSKVKHDLARLKKDVRSLGKGISLNDLSVLQRLNEADRQDLMAVLAEVCVLKNGELPEELTSPKSPVLLLNALLAHHVCTTFFRNPFFFLENGLGDDSPQSGLDSQLNEIYSRMQQGKCIQVSGDRLKKTDRRDTANEEKAHVWRSQTLRVLQPQLRNNTTSQEKDLRHWTSELISKVASVNAAKFLEGPARHLIREESRANATSRLQGIYEMAANISYSMWTRRATMKCYTLKDLGPLPFDPESSSFVPHPSVRFDMFEDQLQGRRITLIVHPLLKLFGTDDAKGYDQGSVWAPAEVWLDSRKVT